MIALLFYLKTDFFKKYFVMSLNVHVFLLCLAEHVLYPRPRVARETLRVPTSLQRRTQGSLARRRRPGFLGEISLCISACDGGVCVDGPAVPGLELLPETPAPEKC